MPCKFDPHVTVFAGDLLQVQKKGWMHFVEERTNNYANYYINDLLPPPKEVMFSLRSVCLSVCLSVRRITEKVVNGF